MQHLLSKLQTPAFKTLVAIVGHVGSGMAVTRQASFHFPTCTVQVWEFTPQTPPLERPAVCVAVALAAGQLTHWTPLTQGYTDALAHYRDLAAQTTAPSVPTKTPAGAFSTAQPTVLVLPTVPGVQWTMPPTLAGKPVRLAMPTLIRAGQ